MARRALTEAAIARLKAHPPQSGRAEIWQDGLGYRLTATGAESFVVLLRKPGTAGPARYKLEATTLRAAVKEARVVQTDPAAFFAGRQQAAAARDQAPTNTFKALAEQFLESGRSKRGRELRASTLKEYERALLVYAKALHDRPASSIRRADVADVIEQTARTAGTVSAMRCRAALSRLFSWLIAKGRVEYNPVTGTEGFDVKKRDRVLSDAELRALWQATETLDDFNRIIRLCLWTGCRSASEAGAMRWSEIAGDTWTKPGTAIKNHRELAVPLPRQAVAMLQACPQVVGRDLVFGVTGKRGFNAWSKSKERLDQKLGFDEPWQIRDIRRTVETGLSKLGVPQEIINRTLNHAVGSVITATYNRNDFLEPKRAALQSWADWLDWLTAPAPETNVVRIKSA